MLDRMDRKILDILQKDCTLPVAEIGKQIGARLMTAPIGIYLTLFLIYFVVNRGISAATRLLEKRERFNRLFLRV